MGEFLGCLSSTRRELSSFVSRSDHLFLSFSSPLLRILPFPSHPLFLPLPFSLLSVLGPIPLQQRNELINHLAGWSYRPYVLSQDDLFRCNCLLFEATLSIEDQIKRFLFSVKSLYHSPNPYHNYTHGSDVLQATYSFLVALGVAPPISTLLGTKGTRPAQPWKRPSTTHGRAAEVLRPQDVLTLMIAAIGHDGAHPGLSNAFLKNAKAPLSQVYEDKSALEHLHCILVVSLLKKHGFGWLFAEAKAARAAVVDFRKLLFGTILATDMSMHFGWMSSLVEMGEQGGMGVGGLSLSEGAKERLAGKDRLMVLQALMKCADISNPVSRPVSLSFRFFFERIGSSTRRSSNAARPVDISEYWSSALLDEWHQQATLEIGLALPVSVVKHADAGLQAKGQIAFQDLFVAPLFDATAVVMPELSPFAEQCSSNRALWFERLSKLTAPDATSKPRSRLSPTSPAAQASPLPSHPDEDVAPAFPIPCPMNSRYRSLFPLTLPPALIALPTSPSRESFENEQPNGKSLLGTPRHHEHVPQRELSATSLAGARGGEGAGALKVAYASGEEARRR
ncbi:hypothetical protein BDY24DRAFT_341660 [Mrakia frigida]|uniref:3',5'-cyclic nucleotide phosphodiesterase n=1 Tax=Mrakia frigida TaxID=29902 RepID=UPI003FCC163B